jgi:hypothetical protein
VEIVVIFIAVAILFAILGHVQAERRKKELGRWARTRGLSLSTGKDRTMEDRFAQFSCLRSGRNRYAFNLMDGTCEGRYVCAFDYHYETSSSSSKGGSSTSHHYFSAVVVEANLPLKPLFIRTENFLDKVGEFLGFDDIDFELEEFSREFCVKSPDRRWAFDVLHQATMEFLLESPRFNLAFGGTQVIAHRDSTFSPANFEAALRVVGGVLDRLPEYLLRELKGVD